MKLKVMRNIELEDIIIKEGSVLYETNIFENVDNMAFNINSDGSADNVCCATYEFGFEEVEDMVKNGALKICG